jgi:hypothetical protein
MRSGAFGAANAIGINRELAASLAARAIAILSMKISARMGVYSANRRPTLKPAATAADADGEV